MSYFTNRPRAYSKPTKEETKELSSILSRCSAHDLRSVMLSAANESSDVAHLFMKIMKDATLNAHSHLQPAQPNQQHVVSSSCYPETGLLTPTEISEDSEMSGTEAIQNQTQHLPARPGSFIPTPSHMTSPTTLEPGLVSLKRPKKRKSLADRDDYIPSHSSLSQSAFLTKRRKSSSHPSEPQLNHDKMHCLNCGLWTSNSRFENLYGCIYHPGEFNFDGTVCSWSCCRNSDLKSCGCLITRHKALNRDAWFDESEYPDGLLAGDGRTMQCDDHGQMSQYARLISIKG